MRTNCVPGAATTLADADAGEAAGLLAGAPEAAGLPDAAGLAEAEAGAAGFEAAAGALEGAVLAGAAPPPHAASSDTLATPTLSLKKDRRFRHTLMAATIHRARFVRQTTRLSGCSIRLVGRLGWPVKDTVPEEGQVFGSRRTFEGAAELVAARPGEHRDAGSQPVVVDRRQFALRKNVGGAERLHRGALQHGRGACPKPGGEAAIGLLLEHFDHVLGASQGPAHAALGEAVLDELVAIALNGAQAAALGPGRQPVAVISRLSA